MPNPNATTAVPSRFPRICQWVLGGGIAAGFLLCALAGTLPERLQATVLFLGIGLMLAGITATLAYTAREARLQWRGISPVIGVLIGALPFLGPVCWHYLESHGHREGSRTPLQAHSPALSATSRIRSEPEPMFGWHIARAKRATVPLDPNSDSARRRRMLDELAGVFAEKGRPAILPTAAIALLVARGRNLSGLRPRLDAARSGLAEFQESLNKIRSGNPSFREELHSLLGDTRPLDEVVYGLGEVSESTGDAGALRDAGQKLRSVALQANEWILGCEKRLDDLRTSVEGAQ